MADRLIAYIDGFNLYRGMRQARMKGLLWLDVGKLAKNLCPRGATVVMTKYFTARILNLKQHGTAEHAEAEASRRRQSEYIDAIKARGVSVFEGKFKLRRQRCLSCNATWDKPEEKATDVQLATHLLCDAFRKNLDMAMIISGDADLAPAIRVVARELNLPAIVAFPPKRILTELKGIATSWLHINRQQIKKCQLPEEFEREGHTFKRPIAWRSPPTAP